MASPWAKATPKVTDWSEQVEEEEAQNGGDLGPPPGPVVDDEAFPSLGDAAKVKAPKKNKKGGKTMSLGEFVGSGGPPRRRVGPMMSDREIKMSLPTAPRERAPGEEDGGGWGAGRSGGFGGGYARGGFGDRDDRDRRDDMGPSRADEADDWGSGKQFVPSGGGYGGRSGGGFGGFSNYDRPRSAAGGYDPAPMARASDSDNWSRDNRFEPSRDQGRGRSGFGFYEPAPPRRGYGFRDRDPEPMRSGGFGDRDRGDGGSWNRARSYTPNSEGGMRDDGVERPRLKLAPRSKPAAGPGSEGGGGEGGTPSKRSSIFGSARPREEVLKERGGTVDGRSSRSDVSGSAPHPDRATPTSEMSSRAGTPASPSARSPREAPRQPFVRRKPAEDPFGGARPREDVLGQRMMEKDAEEELSKGIEAM